MQLNSLLHERDESKKELDVIQKAEYSEFKSNSKEKAASDAKLLGEQERDHQLEEQLALPLMK